MSGQTENTLFGHPKGLFLLFGTEMWERFSYYAMRAILVLYLTAETINGGLGWSNADALYLYGLFGMAVYLMPMLGGFVADRYIGQRKAILLGGVLMAIGLFIMSWPVSPIENAQFSNFMFYAGLAVMVTGTGFLKPNISSLVGQLYPEFDSRRDSAYTIFYVGINVGSLLGGIIVGIVTSMYDYRAGFFCAGIGMLVSFFLQLFLSQGLLGNIGNKTVQHANANTTVKQPLTPIERDRMRSLLCMCMFSIVFWVGYDQAGGLMNLYANSYTDRMIGDFEVPTAWFQSINPLLVILLGPLISLLWIKLGKKEPSAPIKFSFGMFFLAAAFICMSFAALEQNGNVEQKTSMIWLFGFYFFCTVGELCLSPIGLSVVSKLAPVRFVSFMMACFFLAMSFGNMIIAFIGAHIDDFSALSIFSGIAAAAVVTGLLIIVASRQLVDWMHDAPKETTDEIEPSLDDELTAIKIS